MTDVFVSYARADKERVEQIAQALTGLGFEVWWDPDLLPGQQYAAEIGTILQSAKAVMVMWSANSIKRHWVLDEAAVGRDRGVLVPVRLDAADSPLGFRQFQAVDLSGWTGASDHPGFTALVKALTAMRGAAPMPQAFTPTPGAAPPKRAKSSRRLIALGVVAACALAIYGAIQLPGGPAVVTNPQDHTTDAPGAGAMYGLTPEELIGFSPHDLIRIALASTDLEMIQQGASAGDALGQALSCLAYAYGEGAGQDLLAARRLCEAASDQGDDLATYMLSRWMRVGEAGFTADPSAADVLLTRAADGRDPRALTERGRALLEAGDPAGAAGPIEAAALLGHHPAQILFGWMYENGQGTAQDDQEAFRWYDAAAEKAYPAGLTATGRLLEEGRGVGQSFERARARYEEAVGQGDPEAAMLLARLLEQGLGGPAAAARAGDLRAQAQAAGLLPEPAED